MLKSILSGTIILSIFSSFGQENSTHCAKRKKYANATEKSNSLTINQIAETEKYDVTFYNLDLNMTNLNTSVSGSSEIHGKAVVALDSVLFELFSSFTISSIELNGLGTVYTRVGSAIKVPVNLTPNQAFIIKVNYSGTPPNASTNPLGGAGMTNASSPSWGNQVTWSLSEPFSAYEWFPCKQSLTDKADSSEMKITVPSACKAGSNGVLENVVDLGATTRYEWKHRHPIVYYLISVSVAQYVEYNVTANPIGSGPVLIQNFIYNNPNTLPNFQSDIDETVDFMELFAEKFGPYPYANEKYGHCMAPISGGMEHQTMTTQGFFERGLTSHELAHQWFGNYVTCGRWSDIWVNEGFASYSEYIMLENLYTATQAATDMNDRHTNIKSQAGGSVWVLDSLNEGAIFSGRLVYDKGAAIIHTMRYLINDDVAFYQGLKNYQTTFANSTAIGMDVKAEMEAVSGVDLTEFFEQWYFGEGYPTYSAKYNLIGTNLNIQINHTVSRPNITPTFTNPIDIRVTRVGAADTILRLAISSNSDNFVIPNMGNFNAITQLDFRNWIINNQGSIIQDNSLSLTENSTLKKDVILYPNPTEGKLFISNENNETLELVIFDTKGAVIVQQTIGSSFAVDLSNQLPGNYLVEVKNGTEKITRKVIKL
jgi:aminopeptidase N